MTAFDRDTLILLFAAFVIGALAGLVLRLWREKKRDA